VMMTLLMQYLKKYESRLLTFQLSTHP